MLENIKVLITISSRALVTFLSKQLASILLFQGSIGLEVCESVFIEGETKYVLGY